MGSTPRKTANSLNRNMARVVFVETMGNLLCPTSHNLQKLIPRVDTSYKNQKDYTDKVHVCILLSPSVFMTEVHTSRKRVQPVEDSILFE